MSKRPFIISIEGVGSTVGPLDPRVVRTLKAANDLAEGPSGDIGFVHSIMCQNGLPFRRPPIEQRIWEQENGFTSMRIEAGSVYDPDGRSWHKLPLRPAALANESTLHSVLGASPCKCFFEITIDLASMYSVFQ